ncbi:MAG: aminopeptidase P family protein [Chloroflexi bacterium]|nr:aminopeptidase P family protein [Chloroflexota bacterium]
MEEMACPDIEESIPAPGPRGEVTAQEYRLRVDALRAGMARKKIDVALVQYSRDIYYYSGAAYHGSLVIPRKGEPVFLVRINVSGARAICWIRDIRESSGHAEVCDLLRELNINSGTIGIGEDVTPLSVSRKLSDLLPGFQFADIGQMILDQRMVKSVAEVAMVKKAARISRTGLRRAEAMMSAGVSEVAIFCEMETAKRLAGHDGVNVFRRLQTGQPATFVASGANAGMVSGYWVSIIGPGSGPAFPYGPSHRKLRQGDLVFIDHGTVYRGYHCDHARTYVVGTAREKHHRLFDVVRRAQDAAINIIRPGIPVSDIYLAAWRAVEGSGFEKYYMARGEYGVDYLGHGLGLEIDEPPFIGPKTQTIVEEGMVLALEPKLVIPGWGGLGLEDTVVVTCDGCAILTEGKRELMEVGA